MTAPSTPLPPATNSCCLYDFVNDGVTKFGESFSCLKVCQINTEGADADGIISKIVKVAAFAIMAIPAAVVHIIRSVITKITDCICGSAAFDATSFANAMDPVARTAAKTALAALPATATDAEKRTAIATVTGLPTTEADIDAVVAAIIAWVPAPAFDATAFTNALDAAARTVAKDALAALPATATDVEKRAAIATVPGLPTAEADQDALVAAIVAWAPAPAFDAQVFFNTITPANQMGAKNALVALPANSDAAAKRAAVATVITNLPTVEADADAVVALIDAIVPFNADTVFNAMDAAAKAAAKAAVSGNGMTDVEKRTAVAPFAPTAQTDAEKDALVALLAAYVVPFNANTYFAALPQANKDAAKAALTAVHGGDAAMKRNAVANLAGISAVDAERDAVIALIEAMPAPGIRFVTSLTADAKAALRGQLATTNDAAARRAMIVGADAPAADADKDVAIGLVMNEAYNAAGRVASLNDADKTAIRFALSTVAADAAVADKRNAIQHAFAAWPVAEADQDAIVAAVSALPYPLEAFMTDADEDEITQARIALAALPADAAAMPKRAAIGNIADLPAVDAEVDAIVAKVMEKAFPVAAFLQGANIAAARIFLSQAADAAARRNLFNNGWNVAPTADADKDAAIAHILDEDFPAEDFVNGINYHGNHVLNNQTVNAVKTALQNVDKTQAAAITAAVAALQGPRIIALRTAVATLAEADQVATWAHVIA